MLGACPPPPAPPQGVDRRSMLYEERLEAAERRRKEGNTLFAEGKYTEALGKYAMVSWTPGSCKQRLLLGFTTCSSSSRRHVKKGDN